MSNNPTGPGNPPRSASIANGPPSAGVSAPANSGQAPPTPGGPAASQQNLNQIVSCTASFSPLALHPKHPPTLSLCFSSSSSSPPPYPQALYPDHGFKQCDRPPMEISDCPPDTALAGTYSTHITFSVPAAGDSCVCW
jgi:hypothetical protein